MTLSDSPDAPVRRGRPPDATLPHRILSAAADLLDEVGFAALTVEAVAERAGVGKPSIYKHFPNARALGFAVLGTDPALDPVAPRGPAPAALAAQIGALVAAFATPRGAQIGQALAAAPTDARAPDEATAFRTTVLRAPRAAWRQILLRGAVSGDFVLPDDLDAFLDMVYGAILLRLMTGIGPLDSGFAAGLTSAALSTLAPIAKPGPAT